MTAEMIERAEKLRAEGLSYSKIGDIIGVSRSTVSYHLDPKVREYSERYRSKHKAEKRQYDIEYRKKNAELLKEKKKRYYESHKKEILSKAKLFRAQHPGFRKEYNRRYRLQHREYLCQYARRYYRLHRNELRHRNHEYALAHAEEARKRAEAWQRNHPEKARANRAKRRARERNALVSLTSEQRKAIEDIYKRAKEAPRVRCYLCGKLIPKGHRHVDHIVPLAKGGKHVPSNLAIVCDQCNWHKHTKLPQEVGLLL